VEANNCPYDVPGDKLVTATASIRYFRIRDSPSQSLQASYTTGLMAANNAPHTSIQRVAMTLDIKPELVNEYIAKHATPRQNVVDALRSVGLRNLSLWVSRERLFYYAEFAPIGRESFDEAMVRYAAMPGVKEWEEVC
jgi:L-rhamnose mutarotase